MKPLVPPETTSGSSHAAFSLCRHMAPAFSRSLLVPRWILIWGFVAIVLRLSTAFLLMFRIIDSDSATIMNLPIFLQEMVMAIWLIVRGFDSSAPTVLLDSSRVMYGEFPV